MNQLNWFEAWMLDGILRKIIRNRHLSSLFFEILMKCRYCFHEDNDPTLLCYVTGEFELGKGFYSARQAAELQHALRKAVKPSRGTNG